MKASLLSAAVVVAPIALAACSTPLASSQRYIAAGDQYLKAKQWNAASIEYRNAVKRAPTSVEAHDRLAKVAAILGDKATTASERLWIANAEPRDLQAQLAAGEACVNVGRLDDAEPVIVRAVSLAPQKANTNRALAVLYMETGRADKAEPYWTLITTLPDGDPFALADFYAATDQMDKAERELRNLAGISQREDAALLRLAKLFYAHDRTGEGDKTLDVLLAHNPHDEAGWILRGQMLLRRGSETAQQAFLNAFAADPSSIDALTGLTLVDISSQKPQQAIARIEEHLRQAPDSVPLLILAARTYAATESFDKAEQVLTRAVQLQPLDADAHALMGRVYLGEGRTEDARLAFERAAAVAPDSAEANTLLAMLEQTRGHWSEARETYQRVLNDNPRAAVAANNLAWLDLEDGRLDEALRYGEVAHEELRGVPHVEDTLGWIYYNKGRFRDSLPLLAAAVEAQPQNVLFHYHLGMAYWKAENPRAAREELNRALTMSPSFAGRDDAVAAMARITAKK